MSYKNRCGQHLSEQRTFCVRNKNHEGTCSQFPVQQGVVSNSNLGTARLAIQELETDLKKLRHAERLELKDTKIVCTGSTFDSKNGCDTELAVSDLVFIRTHWYTSPSGCSDGDYWNTGEGQFECPQCGVINRLYERPQVDELQPYFKETKDTY